MGRVILKHSIELFVLDFAITGIVDRFDQFFHIDGQLKLLIYYFYKHFFIDMTTFVCWTTNCSVRIQCILIILAVQFCCLQLLVHLQNGLKFDVAFVVGVEFRDEFA